MQYFCKVIVLYRTYFVFKKVELEAHLVPRLFFGTTKRRDFSPLGLYVLVFPSPLRLQKTIFSRVCGREKRKFVRERGEVSPPPSAAVGRLGKVYLANRSGKSFPPLLLPPLLSLPFFEGVQSGGGGTKKKKMS